MKQPSTWPSWEDNAAKPWLWLSAALLLAVALLNAWVSDDAYITFRTCHNLVHGFGPVYNVGERVQTFTNPLWMLLFSGIYAVTGESYFSAIGFSLVLLGTTVWLMQRFIFKGSWAGVMMVFLLGWSASFVEYATSGLENVLNGCLLTAFVAVAIDRGEGPRKLLTMSLLCGFGLVSRMDTALLYFPLMAVTFWRMRSSLAIGTVLLGLSPFILWELFATFYYGFPFPNTAYAKLNAGIANSVYLEHGIYYYLNALRRDPMALATIALALGICAWRPMRKQWPIAAGLALYLLYILRIGGDFMAGRFFFLPVLVAALLVGMALMRGLPTRLSALMIGILLLLGIVQWHSPWYNGWRPQQPLRQMIDAHGVADERGWYHDAAALTAIADTTWVLSRERRLDEVQQQPGPQTVLFWDFLGYMGYGEGPRVSLYDRYALADPLLARLPMSDLPDWRIGHFERNFPRGYRKTLRTGTNHIQDENLCKYYDRLCVVTRAPLDTWGRLEIIIAFNLGEYDDLIDGGFYRHPSPLDVSLSALQTRHPQGERYRAKGQIELWNGRPTVVHLDGIAPFGRFEISLQSECDYRLSFPQRRSDRGGVAARAAVARRRPRLVHG